MRQGTRQAMGDQGPAATQRRMAAHLLLTNRLRSKQALSVSRLEMKMRPW